MTALPEVHTAPQRRSKGAQRAAAAFGLLAITTARGSRSAPQGRSSPFWWRRSVSWFASAAR